MKILHMGDLHIGKSLNGFSLLEDQRYILEEILGIAEKERPDAALIAGDVYDKAQPSAEAVSLFDSFLTGLSKKCGAVFVISGNHDSPQRIAFGSELMKNSGVHLSPAYAGKIEPVILNDEYGQVGFYLFPFVKPANVRAFFPDEEVDSYEKAFRLMAAPSLVPAGRRNIAVAHQFIVGAGRVGSEEISVGGLDEISASVFAPFDYTALGHIHRPQSAGRETVRYSGSVLKYSFSETEGNKSVTLVELKNKGETAIRTVALHPLREMRTIKGTYEEITYKKNYENTNTEDYVRVILTDSEEIPDAVGRLRSIYPNIMELGYDNARTRESVLTTVGEAESLSPVELFARLYEEQNNTPLSGEQRGIVERAAAEAFSE